MRYFSIAAGIGLAYVTNDDSMNRPFEVLPVIVNYFCHETVRKSAGKGTKRTGMHSV